MKLTLNKLNTNKEKELILNKVNIFTRLLYRWGTLILHRLQTIIIISIIGEIIYTQYSNSNKYVQ